MLAAGGSAGALLGAPFADFLGRKYSVATMAGLFLLGCALQEVPRLNCMYAGRLLAGVAIGAQSMVCRSQVTNNVRFVNMIQACSPVPRRKLT